MKITPHFYRSEFDCKDETKYPTVWIDKRLRPLCAALETIRAACGNKPVTIVSGYRTKSYNTKIGGARHSQHMEGTAADIVVEDMSPSAVHAVILRLHQEGKIKIGGLGFYNTFTHVDIRPGRLRRWAGSRVTS